MARAADPEALRTTLPVDDVPQIDEYLSPARPSRLTPGVVVAILALTGAVIFALIGAVVHLATRGLLDDTLRDVGDFLARDDIPLLAAIASLLGAAAGFVAVYLKLRAAEMVNRRGAKAANNAEAHVGKRLPEQIAAVQAQVEEVGALLVGVAPLLEQFAVDRARQEADQERARQRYRQDTGAMPAVEQPASSEQAEQEPDAVLNDTGQLEWFATAARPDPESPPLPPEYRAWAEQRLLELEQRYDRHP